jgi:hypothetical protein
MVQDWVYLRKGMNTKVALSKAMDFLGDYLLSNSKDFKLVEGITINFSGGWEDEHK